VTGKKIDQYGKFQYPDIFGSILECGLLMTLLILPTPALKLRKLINSGELKSSVDNES
jgi:hypothetical protein